MKIYARSDVDGGAIVRYSFNAAVERAKGPPADGTYDAANTIDIDFETNPTILVGLEKNVGAFTVIGGALQKDGAPVVINPPRQTRQIVNAIAALPPSVLDALQTATLEYAVVMKQGGTPTTQQTQRALAFALLAIIESMVD